jgi:hypothetical protein
MKRRWLIALLALSCSVLSAAPIGAQPEEEPPAASGPPPPLTESLTGAAKDEYEAARLLYQDGDYAGAKLKFERAHELSKDARLLWNMAAAEKNLRHYASVLRLLDRYLAEGGELLTPTDRADAQSVIDTVKSFVAKLTIEVNEAGAEVSIDDQVVGTSPLAEPVLVDMGTRRIRVEKAGFKSHVENKKLPGGGEVRVQVKLSPDRHEGTLRVVAGSGDTIRVDGKVVGKGQWEGKLPSGAHTLSVSASGKRTFQTDVVVSDDQTRTERVQLEAEAAAGDPMRDRDSGPPWAWIGAGAALAVGIGVGAYFLLRDDEAEPARAIPGTIPPGSVQLGFW